MNKSKKLNPADNPGLLFLKKQESAIVSPINVCFTGKSSAGSWQIRGDQIAAKRLNWFATNKPTKSDLERSDLICVVKKPDLGIVDLAHEMGKPIVYDIIDSWAQPDEGISCPDVQTARALFSRLWGRINADGYIFPTRQMENDLGLLVKERITIYHHYWPQIQKNPIRKTVKTIGYEGADFLGEWLPFFKKVCEKRNIEFVVNPENYTDMDIVVLARGGAHGSFLARNYKSNIKLANAYGSGTPALVHFDEMAPHNVDTGDVMFFTSWPGSFERQLDALIDNYALRMTIHENFLKAACKYHVDSAANQFEAFFMRILKIRRSSLSV